MDPITQLVNFILNLISSAGYPGIFVAMILESALVPIPSEIIMSFSGYLAALGTFNFWLVVLVGTLGDLVGACIAYIIGLKVGRAAILRYGRYVLLREHHLVIAETWFKKQGNKAIFLSRMAPAVRSVISLPAGIARMDPKKFSIYTVLGSIPWNLALAYTGYLLGVHWSEIGSYDNILDVLVITGIAIAIVVYLIIRKRGSISKSLSAL